MANRYSPQVLDSGTAGVSGLQFVRLTSAAASTAGVAYLGVDVSGNIVVAPAPAAAGGGKGLSTINFGAFPGGSDATSLIVGQTAITAGSFVQAWLVPTTTADHTSDEHLVDSPIIMVGNINPGIGFTIYGIARICSYIDDAIVGNDLYKKTANSPLVYGQWSVAWTWS